MYVIIKGRSADGIGLAVVSDRVLRDRALRNPAVYGIGRFEDEMFLVMHPEPEEWPEGTVVLLALSGNVLMPRQLPDGTWLLD